MKKLILMLSALVLILAGCGTTTYEAMASYTVDAVPASEGEQ